MYLQRNNTSILLVLTSCLLFTLCRAQSYFKIPIDTNYYWRQFSLCYTTTPTNFVHRQDYQIRYYNDTTVNGKIYNKYAPFGRSFGYCCCSSFTKYGLLRQDTLARKVYILDNNFAEQPLYDFTKQVGDTFLHYNRKLNANVTFTVEAIQTATLSNGTLRKALWVTNNNCFIEGVGSVFGGLYGDDQMFFTLDNISEQLMCFGIRKPFYKLMDGITQQMYNCALVDEAVGLSETTNFNVAFQIIPNPNNGAFFIQINNQIDAELNYKLINVLGQEVLKGILNIIAEKSPMDISGLSNGIYSLYLINSTGIVWQTKVIKQD